jgi:anti-sigma28 factor (negative regulator of flagellin synthesis)
MDGGGIMEINDHSKLKAFAQVGMLKNGKKASKQKTQAPRTDKLELSSKTPEYLKKNQEIRPQKVNDAKEQVLTGKYDNPEVVDKIVSRLIRQFGY